MSELHLNMLMPHIKSILDSYTLDHQIEQTMSEMEELQVELVEYQRPFHQVLRSKFNLQNLHGEIADVLIMATQMALAFGVDKVNQQIDFKVNRQLQRIEERDEAE